jgi:hypothetical protein
LALPSVGRAAPLPARVLVTVHARILVYNQPGAYAYPGRNAFRFDPRKVTFSPSLINVGTVIIDIADLDGESHIFEIDGVFSSVMGPNGRTVMKVTFRKPGIYFAGLVNDDGYTVTGALRVIK